MTPLCELQVKLKVPVKETHVSQPGSALNDARLKLEL